MPHNPPVITPVLPTDNQALVPTSGTTFTGTMAIDVALSDGATVTSAQAAVGVTPAVAMTFNATTGHWEHALSRNNNDNAFQIVYTVQDNQGGVASRTVYFSIQAAANADNPDVVWVTPADQAELTDPSIAFSILATSPDHDEIDPATALFSVDGGATFVAGTGPT